MSFKILIIMTLLLASVNALANDGHASGSAVDAAKAMRTSDKYTQGWVPLPALSLKNMDNPSADPVSLKPQKGRVQIVVFLASWCIPCQQLMPDLKRIAEAYKNKYTDIVYVFAHDTELDAKAFSSYHKVSSSAYLGTAKVLEDYHQPELPALYMSDRYGWLVYRKLNLKTAELSEIEKFLDLHTSF